MMQIKRNDNTGPSPYLYYFGHILLLRANIIPSIMGIMDKMRL